MLFRSPVAPPPAPPTGASTSTPAPSAWRPLHDPWTGLVQAWSMPWTAPSPAGAPLPTPVRGNRVCGPTPALLDSSASVHLLKPTTPLQVLPPMLLPRRSSTVHRCRRHSTMLIQEPTTRRCSTPCMRQHHLRQHLHHRQHRHPPTLRAGIKLRLSRP